MFWNVSKSFLKTKKKLINIFSKKYKETSEKMLYILWKYIKTSVLKIFIYFLIISAIFLFSLSIKCTNEFIAFFHKIQSLFTKDKYTLIFEIISIIFDNFTPSFGQLINALTGKT